MQKKEKYMRIFIIILIIIILIIIFFSRFGKINNYAFPTGNVDVFDIDIDIAYPQDSDISNKEKDINQGNNGVAYSRNNSEIGRIIPKYNPEEDREVFGRVFVDDKNGDYMYQENLRIFDNAAYQYTNKIAPGVSNTYHFVVHNSSDLNLKYYIDMYEDSEYKVNLRYRLKRNNEYIIGDDERWVTAADLKTGFKDIALSTSDSYSLDWKWVYDENDEEDTLAGKNMTSEYKLNARFYFEQI